jgi:hypothetical protein
VRCLGRHEPLGAVEVRAEADAVVADGHDLAGALAADGGATLHLVGHRPVAHREDLEAARVRDDRPTPAHERVQAAEARDELVTWIEEEVERVAEHHVVAQRRDLAGQEPLDRGLRRQRHEGRRTDVPVGGVQHPGARARAPVARGDLQGGHRRMVEAA